MLDPAADTGNVVDGRVETTDADGNVTVDALGILPGGQLFQVQTQDIEDQYIIAYQLPGGMGKNFVYFEFQNFEEVEATFGADALPTVHKTTLTNFQELLKDERLVKGGDATEVSGLAGAGTFQQFYRRAQTEALLAAGINDPGLVGKLLDDAEIQQILTLATIAGGQAGALDTPAVLSSLRQTDIWRNDIYNGIDFFYARGDADPEGAWRAYQNATEGGLRELGISPDPDGTYRSTIGDMLNGGVGADEFNEFQPVFKQIQTNPGLKDQLDAWAVFETGQALDFDQFIDVLKGTDDPELNRIVESAGLAFQAEQAGFNISNDEIRRLAENTNLSEAEALQAFTETEAALLSIGDQELAGFGVTQGDFLDVAAGQAPRSGKGAATVRNLAQKLAQERGISDDPKARFFLGFSDEGQAQRQGLNPLGGVGG